MNVIDYRIELNYWQDNGEIDCISIYGDGQLIDGFLVTSVNYPILITVKSDFYNHHASELYDISGQLLAKM